MVNISGWQVKKILPTMSAQRSCKVALEFTLPSITHKKLNFPTVDENGWMGFSCRPSSSFCYPCHCCCCCHQCCSYWAKWLLWSILMGQTPCIGHCCMEAGRGGLVLKWVSKWHVPLVSQLWYWHCFHWLGNTRFASLWMQSYLLCFCCGAGMSGGA